jgi:lipoprotein-anchoring transpeptidase ErfK/SrfK
VTHRRRRVAVVCLVAAAAAIVLAGPAAAATRVTFVQGEQNATVARPGDGLADAVAALMAGPTAAERTAQIRSYIPPRTQVRSVSQAGTVATIDLGSRFVAGTDSDALLARLSQVVATATAVPGVRSVRVLIQGGVPLGLFPGINATVPLTTRALRTPDVARPRPTPERRTPATRGTRGAQQRLADLGYLLPSGVDGQPGPATTTAVIAFQKWEGLQRDGVLGPATLARLRTATRPTARTRGGSGRRAEVLIDRQLVLAIRDNRVVRALHVSTGKPSTPTPVGSFSVYAQFPRWWSTPFREWLLWASPFVGGVAMHQFPDVPVYAASHGCVRVPEANARWLFRFISVGDPVRVLAASR